MNEALTHEAIDALVAAAKAADKEETANPSGIRPTGYKVLVQSEEVDKVTPGGIILPDTVADRKQEASAVGILIAVSPLAFTYHEDWCDCQKPKVGDRVTYGKYSGTVLKGKDDGDYRLINDQDIGAVLEF